MAKRALFDQFFLAEMSTLLFILAFFYIAEVLATCDGNPHGWGRIRRCDQEDRDNCPGVSWASNCQVCEGIGGISRSDTSDDFDPTYCRALNQTESMQYGPPIKALFPKVFTNTGFYEQQIFVKHDPFCIAQIPLIISNGTHCYKRQEGTMHYDGTPEVAKARMDYLKAETIIKGVNMTEYFYHEGTRVHPHITSYGLLPSSPVCPCINVGAGVFTHDWAADGEYLGRAELGIEFLWTRKVVDHWVKGPHHAFVDVISGQIIRLWQPFNGLEVFDPSKLEESVDQSVFKLPLACVIESKTCIDGTTPSVSKVVEHMVSLLFGQQK